MAITNLYTFQIYKRKRLSIILYAIALISIVGINLIFVLLHRIYLPTLTLLSVIAEFIIVLLLNVFAVTIAFYFIHKVLQKQYNDIAQSLINVLKQFEKGNVTYPYAIDNDKFDEVLRLIHRIIVKQNDPDSFTQLINDKAFEIITVLISAMEDKDPYTSGHTARVAQYALAIGKRLGLPRDRMRILNHAAAAHDIGKIGIPIEIIEKKGPLDEKEQILMRSHPIRGMKILSSLDYLQDIATVVMYHHERIDGMGYYQLSGDKIPIEAKIIAVADAFDAMLSDRPYRKALTLKEAKQELLKNSGTQFDPNIVKVFLELLEEKEAFKDIISF